MLNRLVLALFGFLILTACQDYKVVSIKDFRIYADTQDPNLQHAIEVLAKRYNSEIGFHTLSIVRNPADSNSKISFVSGLHNDGHKLGLGQWVATKSQDTKLTIQGESSTETVAYAMEIEFDKENFANKAAAIDNAKSNEAQHLYHLFCHEVGHGLQMDHSQAYDSVMYPTIPDSPTRYINYPAYFTQARSFMNSH